MLPMSSTNHHSHIEPSWKTYYDAKKLLRQTEQRLKDAREYYPHVHLNNHHDNNDLSTVSSSSYLLHGDTTSIHAGNRSMLNDDRTINNKHQLLDSEALQTIRRKINKQKIAAERRAEQLFHSQSDAGHMFESYRPHTTYSTSASLQNLHYSPHRQQRFSPPKPQPSYSSHLSQSQSFPSKLDNVLRHSTSSRILHKENEIDRQSFHQPMTRKITKVIPNDNYSLSNGRSTQQRSASASNGLSTKYQDLPSSHVLTPTNAQRLKHVRRVESAHVSSNPGAKTSLITPDSWRTEPVVTKKPSTLTQQEKSSKQKTTTEINNKRTKTDIEEPLAATNQRTEKIVKSKRDTSASKPSIIITEKTPLKPPPPSKPKSDDEKKKVQDYIQQKRQEHEEILSNEQEKNRKDKFKKINEPIKETSHQYLPSSLTKRTSAFTPITPKDLTEQTRQRLLRLLGPSTDYPINNSSEQPLVLEHSSSSSSSLSSSSNDSVIEMQSTKSNDQLPIRSRSEPPIQNGAISHNVQRHENLLRWAVNITKDCDIVENRFKHLRPDGTQPFNIIPSSLYQHDDGNLRYQTNNSDLIKSRLSNGRLNDNRDLSIERGIYHNRAAAKIQAAYRGYTVRKSLPRFNEKEKHLHDEFNKRPIHYRETASVNIDIRLTNNHFPVDPTFVNYYENSPIDDYQQQQIARKTTILPLYSDDYDNVPNVPLSNLSTPINHKQIPIINANLSINLPSTNSSTSTTPIPSPEPHVPSQIERRRSISPPLPPQMSPDNGRPLHHLTQITSQHSIDGNIDLLERSKATSREQNLPVDTSSQQQQQLRKSPIRQSSTSSSSSSSTSTNRKRRSPSPQQQQQQTTIINTHSRHRTPQNSSPPTSSSESILTAREKRVRQKFNSDIELQAYEKRLKDIEKKIRQLVKRAFEIFDEKRSVSSPPSTVVRTTKTDLSTNIRSKSPNYSPDESSISEEISLHRKETEPLKKDNDISSNTIQGRQSDVGTSDASDLERRVRACREQLEAKRVELENLKRKNKELLRRQEHELKKQIESCDHEIQKLSSQPIQQEQTVPVPSLTNRFLTEETKPIVPITAKSEKQDFFDKNQEEEIESRPAETPRDERDTQHDAQSISDLQNESETDNDSRRESFDNEQPIINLNINLSIPYKANEDSISSSSSSKTNEKPIKSPSPQVSKSPSSSSSSESIKAPSPVQERIQSPSPPSSESIKAPSPPPVQKQIPIPIIEQKQTQPSIINNEYDEDFSEVSHSPINTSIKKNQIDDIDIESIQTDIEDKPSIHGTIQSSTSKSSGDEQSEILVLVKKSANNTPRQQDEKSFQEELPLPSLPISFPSKIELDDTSHDLSEDDERIEQENKIDQLTETLIRTFIDEAIDHGKEIENNKNKNSMTKEASEWMSDEDLTDEENNKQIPITHEEDVDNVMQTLSTQPEFLEQLDTTPNGMNEHEELKLDLSRLEDKNLDEPRVESPRKSVVEEPTKPVVSHTREQVIQLCHQAITILYNQNTDFSDRSTINRTIPDSYFNSNQEDSDNPDIRRSRHAYCRMIFDLCLELLYEMFSPNVRITNYPEWQKTKLISKRFYRSNKPKTCNEAELFIQTKVLEILNLIPRQIIYTKWRMPIGRQNDTEQFEIVLDEELRRTEIQWIDYEDDSIRIKFDIAEYIFEQLVQETLTECFHVINKRLLLSSNSTRL